MRSKRIVGCALVATLATAGLAGFGSPAGADVEGTLVSCSDTSNVDIGDAKIAPGLTTVERKNVLSGAFTMPNCTADEGELDEIATESKFGVTKTAAAGRPAIAKAAATFKFTFYGDCLGIIISDPDDTGEYRPTGTIAVKWLSAANKTAGTSSVFGVLTTTTVAQVSGMVTKGLGVGADVAATVGYVPKLTDDSNGNQFPDLLDCVLGGDPSATGKLVDIVTNPASLTVDLPVTP